MFVVIEGIDAAGKATQTRLLGENFRKHEPKRDVFFYTYPNYNGPLGKEILAALQREDLSPWLLQGLMCMDKSYGDAELREQRKNPNNVIISDRYWPSGVVYAYADGLDFEVNRRIASVWTPADLYVLVDVDPSVALQRRPDQRDRYEKNRTQQQKVRQIYRDMWAAEAAKPNNGCWLVVDGHQSAEAIATSIWRLCSQTKTFLDAAE